MQIAIAHNAANISRLDSTIISTLSRTFPELELYQIDLTKPQQSFPGNSVIISLGLDVAAAVNCDSGTRHICYLTPSCLSEKLPTAERLSAIIKVGFSDEMTDGAFADCQEYILPPANTRFFSPSNEQRNNACLLIVEDGWNAAHQLAVAACKLADKKLTILGTNVPTELTEHDCVTWIPLTDSEILKQLYQNNQVLLVPQNDSFEITVIEAQACGQPVIAFAESQTAKFLIDAESTGFGTGLLFDELSAESLASTIEELDRRPQHISASLAWGNAARFSTKRFEQEFDILVHSLFDESLIQFPKAKPIRQQDNPPSDQAA